MLFRSATEAAGKVTEKAAGDGRTPEQTVEGYLKALQEHRFSDAFEERLAWMRQITRQRATPLLPISTERGVAEQIRDLLGGARR